MPSELTRSFLEKVVRSSGWALSEVESLSLEGESISCLGDSFAGVGKLVYLSLARNNISSLLGIEHLSSLSTAILSANRVSSMGEVGRLARLPNLRNLDLRLNPIMASPQIGGGSSGSGSSRDAGGGGGSGGIRHGVYRQHDATAAAPASRERQEQEDPFFASNPREMVLKELPQLVNLDGQRVEDSERWELRRRCSAAATLMATSADRHWEEVASTKETRYIERREEEAIGNPHRSSWSHRDSEVSYGATDVVAPAPRAFAGGDRVRSGFKGEVVGATGSYDERDLRRVGTAPSRGRAVAGRYADAGVRKRDRTGAGVFESGGRDEGVPSLRAGFSGSGGSRAVKATRSRQRPVHVRSSASSQGGGTPPVAASAAADDDDLAALWSELGEGFLEFEQPRAAAVATVVAGRSMPPSRSQCAPSCHGRGCSSGTCDCRDSLHSPPRGSGRTQLFAAELDESASAVSFPGASQQTRYGPRAIEPRLFSDSGVRTAESARRRNVRGGEGDRRIETQNYTDECRTVGDFEGDAWRSGGGGGDSNNSGRGGGGGNSFRGSSGSSQDYTNLAVSSSLISTAPKRSNSSHGSNQGEASLVSTAPGRSSSSSSYGGNKGTTALVARNPDACSGRRSRTNTILAGEAKTVANPANRSNDGGEQREARSRRHPPAHTVSARDTVGRQNLGSAAAPGSISEPSSPCSQRRSNPGSAATPGPLSEPPLPTYSQSVPAPTDSAGNTAVIAESTSPTLYSQPVPPPTEPETSTVVAVADSTPPAQSGSSSSSTTTAAARAVEAFRRSSQRLGLVDASKTGSSSPATSHASGGVAAGGCRGKAPGDPATYQAGVGVSAEGSARGDPAVDGGIDCGDRKPPPPGGVTAELDTTLRRASVGGGNKASGECRGADFTDEASAVGVTSPRATTEKAVPEMSTSTALVVPPAAETAVGSSEMTVSSETAVLLLTGGVAKCEECGTEFRKGCKKGPGAGAVAASASGVVAVSGMAPAAGGGELHERWWAREKEFTSRWAQREREFDARWTAREREFDKRRDEESKEFTRGMRAMLFEAHNALIASNAWLLERLQAAESLRASPPATEADPDISAAPGGGSTAGSAGASGTGSLYPPPPRRTANFVPDTPPTLFSEADREEQRRPHPNRVLIPGNPVDAPSLKYCGGATVTSQEGLPTAARMGSGAPPDVRAGGEHGAGSGIGGTGGRLRKAPALEDGKGRGRRGEAGRVYRDGGALRHTQRGDAGRVYREGVALELVEGDARKNRPLVRGGDDDPAAVSAALPRPRTTDIEPRKTREFPNETSESPAGIAISSEAAPRYRAAVAGGRRDAPSTPGFATSQHLEETATDARGVLDDRTDRERVVSVGGSVGTGRRRGQKVPGSSKATAAATNNTNTTVAGSSASTAAVAPSVDSSCNCLGGAGGGGGGVREAGEGNFGSSVSHLSGGRDRITDGTGIAELVSGLARAHVPAPAESERRTAIVSGENPDRVLDGEPREPSDTRGQEGAVVGGGVGVGVSGGGLGTTILGGANAVLDHNTALPLFDERDKGDAVRRRGGGVGDSGACCPDPEVTTSAPDG